MAFKLSKLLMQELEKADDYELIHGTSHVKIKIGGRLAGIAPSKTTDSNRRATLNVISQVRAIRKEIENERLQGSNQNEVRGGQKKKGR